MDYTQLNTTLKQYLSQFNLNQNQGGCSLTIFHQGKHVTQLAYGMARIDQNNTPQAWQTNTLALNFSTGKGVLVTLIHVLVSQGLLDYDTPIAHYWTAFAQNNKQAITLRQLLTHEARLFDITSVTEHAKDMLNWQEMLDKVAAMPISLTAQQKQTELSTSTIKDEKIVAYSALVSGWILGGLVEQVTNLPLQQALEHYLLSPLALVGQIYIGVPADKVAQVAVPIRDKESRNKPVLQDDSQTTLRFYQALPFYKEWQQIAKTDPNQPLSTQQINNLYLDASQINPQDYKSALVPAGSRNFNYYHASSLQAKMPAVNCVASSDALATMYAMLANQGVWHNTDKHVEIIKPQVFEQLSQIYNQQFDKIMPSVMQWRMGYHRVFSVLKPTSTAFGHMGYNGSTAWCDTTRQLAVAFVHNYDVTMLNDVRQFIINETILEFFQ